VIPRVNRSRFRPVCLEGVFLQRKRLLHHIWWMINEGVWFDVIHCHPANGIGKKMKINSDYNVPKKTWKFSRYRYKLTDLLMNKLFDLRFFRWPWWPFLVFAEIQQRIRYINPSITHRIHGAGIYANIGGILMVNVTIYSIHGSYGSCFGCFPFLGAMKSPFQQWFQSFLVQLHGLTEVPKWLCRDPQTLEIKTYDFERFLRPWAQSERLTHEVNICFSYLNSCKLPSGQSMAHLWLKNIRILDHVLKVLETTLQQTDVALCDSYPQIFFWSNISLYSHVWLHKGI